MKRTALPLDDAALASHELTRRIKDARLITEREIEQSEAPEREAMDALASVLDTRPVDDEDEEPRATKRPKPRQVDISRAKPKPTVGKLPASPDAAFRLMDATFKKWSLNYAKNPREANRELARDLGADGALYIRAEILRLTDVLDAINKLGAIKAVEGDDGGQKQDMEEVIEQWRASIRGEK